jgi:hypothetical protein
MEDIKKHELYDRVLRMAIAQGYVMDLFEFDPKDQQYSELKAAGVHDLDIPSKTIRIGVSTAEHEKTEIYAHELLHAELFLNGFPKIYTHPTYEFQPMLLRTIIEIENTIQHSIIYNKLTELKMTSEEINERFFRGVINDCDVKYEGPNKFFRALRILESSFRLPERTNELLVEVRKKQPHEYTIFSEFLRNTRKTQTPLEMRAAMIKTIRQLNTYLKNTLKTDFFLNSFIRLEPIVCEKLLLKRASDYFYIVKLNEFNELFIMSKEDRNCCFFVVGKAIDIQSLEKILDSKTVKDFLIFMNRS